MPKVNLGKSEFRRDLETALRKEYGGAMVLSEVKREIGTNSREYALSFMDGAPTLQVGKRRKWRIEDVAERIERARA